MVAATSGGGPTDPYWANVKSLLHFDGANGSTTITDQVAGRSWTAEGNASLSNTYALSGGTSLYLDGTGDDIVHAHHSDFNIATGDCTIETFYRPSAIPDASFPFDTIFNKGDNTNGYWLFLYTNGNIYFRDSGSTELVTPAAHGMTVGNTYHIAVVSDAGTWRVKINGVQITSGTGATANTTNSFRWGAHFNTAIQHEANGYFEECRFTSGVCRYPGSGSFTPPTAPFPNS